MKFKDRINRKYLEISLYVILTCVVIYILSLLAGQAGAIFKVIGNGLKWISAILSPVFFGFIIAYLLTPLVGWIQKKLIRTKFFSTREKKARYVAVTLTFVGLVLLIAIFVSLLVLAITNGASTAKETGIGVLIENFMAQVKSFSDAVLKWLEKLNINMGDGANPIIDAIETWAQKIVQYITKNAGAVVDGIKNTAIAAVFSVIISIYFLVDGTNLKKYWGKVCRSLFNQKLNNRLRLIGKDLDYVFSGYIRGQLLDALFMAMAVSISFSIAGVPYGAAVGIFAGIGNLIPYMGPIVGYVMAALAGLVSGKISTLIIAIALIAVIQAVDGMIINPRLLSRNVKVHPVLVLVALIAGGKVGGVWGMIVAVPIAALLKIWFDRLLVYVRKRRKMEEPEEQVQVAETERKDSDVQ